MKARARSEVWRFALAATLSTVAGAAPDRPAPSETPAAAPATPPDHAPATPGPAAPKPKGPVPKPRPRLSPLVMAQLSAQLPPWSPPPPERKDTPAPPPADPDVVRMKPMIVNGNRLPQSTDAKEWLTPKARADLLTKEYLSDFDRTVLNRYTLPIVGISKEARAQMMYEEDKRLQDLRWINDQIEQASKVDPAEAKDLEAFRDDTFTRPISP